MDILTFMYTFGLIITFYHLIWKYLIGAVLSLLAIFSKSIAIINISRAFGYYLLIAPLSILTVFIKQELGIIGSIFLVMLGTTILTAQMFNDMWARDSKFSDNFYKSLDIDSIEDYHIEKKYRHFFLYGPIIGYIVMVYLPFLATNSLTVFVLNIVTQITHIKYIGVILMIFGFLLSASLVIRATRILKIYT